MAPHGDVPRPGSPQRNALCSRLNTGGRKPGLAGCTGHAQQVQEDVAPVSFPLKLPFSTKSRGGSSEPPGTLSWVGRSPGASHLPPYAPGPRVCHPCWVGTPRSLKTPENSMRGPGDNAGGGCPGSQGRGHITLQELPCGRAQAEMLKPSTLVSTLFSGGFTGVQAPLSKGRLRRGLFPSEVSSPVPSDAPRLVRFPKVTLCPRGEHHTGCPRGGSRTIGPAWEVRRGGPGPRKQVLVQSLLFTLFFL